MRLSRFHHGPDRVPGQFAIDARTLPSPAEREPLAAQAANMWCESGSRWIGAEATGEIDGHIFRNETSLGGWRAAVVSGALAVEQAHIAREDQKRRREVAERLLCALEFPAALAHGRAS